MGGYLSKIVARTQKTVENKSENKSWIKPEPTATHNIVEEQVMHADNPNAEEPDDKQPAFLQGPRTDMRRASPEPGNLLNHPKNKEEHSRSHFQESAERFSAKDPVLENADLQNNIDFSENVLSANRPAMKVVSEKKIYGAETKPELNKEPIETKNENLKPNSKGQRPFIPDFRESPYRSAPVSNKKQSGPKLIIGKMTIEVTKPVKQPLLPKHKTNQPTLAPGQNFGDYPDHKLGFGLGQL